MTASCRSCGGPLSIEFLDLGEMPLANSLRDPADESIEAAFPLNVKVCADCFLAQLADPVDPAVIFSDYPYFSSVSNSWNRHAARFAARAVDELKLDEDSLVIEVASNDGYLLRHFSESGVAVLGIEPSSTVARAALAQGLPTEVSFFDSKLASELSSAGKSAELVVANNVLAHVPAIDDFVSGLSAVVKPTGVISIEFPHLLNLIQGLQFDTIYHEHFSYLSIAALEPLLDRHHLAIFDIEQLPTHGGSLRVWIAPKAADRAERATVPNVRAMEAAARIDREEGFAAFAPRVEACRSGFLETLEEFKGSGRRIVGYGAAAKGATFLNYCGVTEADLGVVADRSPHKQGKLMPGSRLPIVAPSDLGEIRPDEILVLAWNLIDEVREEMTHVREWGCGFMTAVPEVRRFP